MVSIMTFPPFLTLKCGILPLRWGENSGQVLISKNPFNELMNLLGSSNMMK